LDTSYNDNPKFIDPIDDSMLPQHLYIILPQSDLEISKITHGNWCLYQLYNKSLPKLVKIKSTFGNQLTFEDLNGNRGEECSIYFKKIIATTDKELGYGDKFGGFYQLPRLPQSFIEYFIAEYNKGNVIKKFEIELEYNENRIVNEEDIGDYSLEINQQNEISIVMPKEKKYGRDEVIEFGLKCVDLGMDLNNNPLPRLNEISGKQYYYNWIKENLK
jgi:hypothetical protein